MPRREAVIERVQQRIDEDLLTDLVQYPTQVRRWYIDNVFRRSLAYLVGFTAERESVMLRATDGGILKTAPTGAGLEVYERNPTSAVDGWITISGADVKTETFLEKMASVDIYVKGYEVYVEISKDGVAWGPKLLLRGDLNQIYSQDVITKSVRLRNVTTDGTANASYQVVGWR